MHTCLAKLDRKGRQAPLCSTLCGRGDVGWEMIARVAQKGSEGVGTNSRLAFMAALLLQASAEIAAGWLPSCPALPLHHHACPPLIVV